MMVRSRPTMLVYAITIFISAFLLFQVQPMIAKIILPWFGGGAAVWSTCMMFFQIVLLLGYLYSHATTRYMKPKAQAILHSILLLVSLVVLAVLLQLPGSSGWKPVDEKTPLLRILILLGATVGLPYLMLSTTRGQLIQGLVRAGRRRGRHPVPPVRAVEFRIVPGVAQFSLRRRAPAQLARASLYVWGAWIRTVLRLASTIYTGWRTSPGQCGDT